MIRFVLAFSLCLVSSVSFAQEDLGGHTVSVEGTDSVQTFVFTDGTTNFVQLLFSRGEFQQVFSRGVGGVAFDVSERSLSSGSHVFEIPIEHGFDGVAVVALQDDAGEVHVVTIQFLPPEPEPCNDELADLIQQLIDLLLSYRGLASSVVSGLSYV